MTNVTITLEEEVARWARIYAAEHDTSVSRMLGDLLKERMKSERAYARAMNRYLRRPASALRKRGEKYPERDEIYDRPVLRGH